MKAKKSLQVIKIERTATPRLISGSDSEDFSNMLVHQVVDSLWLHRDSEEQSRQINAAVIAMLGMKPGDEIEGMLISQLIASHNATMECYRRAMIPEQSFEARRENLNQANKLSRTYAVLTDALDRHRGKGQQRITVEHVNVHAGGQAIVGAVSSGNRSIRQSEEQTRATREKPQEPGSSMRSPDPQWETMPIAAGARKAPL